MVKAFATLVFISVTVLAPSPMRCIETLDQTAEDNIEYNASTDSSWKYKTPVNYEGIFLKLGGNQLLYDVGTCIADLRPTGNGTDLRTCNWTPDACYFFTSNERNSNCTNFVGNNIVDCSQVTWIYNKKLPKSIRVYEYDNSTSRYFTFSYRYFNCSVLSDIPTTERETSTVKSWKYVSTPTALNLSTMSEGTVMNYTETGSISTVTTLPGGFLTTVANFFSGQRILYLLGAAILLVILLIILVALLIYNNVKLKKLKRAGQGATGATVDFEHFTLSPVHAEPSVRSNSIATSSKSNSDDDDDDVYDKLGDQTTSLTKTSRQVTRKSKSSPSPYEEVELPNRNDSAAHTKSTNAKEDTPILEQESNNEVDDTYNTLDLTDLPPPPPPPDLLFNADESNVSQSDNSDDEAERCDGVYDKLDNKISKQETKKRSELRRDDDRSSNGSQGEYDTLQSLSAIEKANTGVTKKNIAGVDDQKQHQSYEDVSIVQVQSDSKDRNYTLLKVKRPATTSTDNAQDEDLYDKVERL